MSDKNHMNNSKLNSISKISRYFITHIQMTLLFMGIILVLGISSLYLLPREQLPEIVFPTLSVQSVYPGASALDVEQLITDSIEAKLTSLDEIDDMVSVSRDGISIVTVIFKEGVDIQKKELEANSLLAEVSLPEDVDIPNVNIFNTSALPLMTFSVSGPYDLASLTSISEDISDEINANSAIDDVTLTGDTQKEIHIVFNALAMYELGLTFSDVQSALVSENIDFPVGSVENGGINTNIRVNNRFEDVSDIGNTIVKNTSGQLFFLDEIADIHMDIKKISLINQTYIKDNGDDAAKVTVYGTVYRKKGEDVVGTSDWIRNLLIERKGTLYPSDVNVDIVYDNANDVKRDLSNIERSALSGLIVVIMVLFLFIGLRESLIVSITMPMSLLMTFGLLSYFGISLNAFAILGLIVALGLLVDNSIIVMENMDRLYKLGYKPYEATLYGVSQVSLPILASTFTTIAAFFPLAILPGVMGAFVNTIPRTIILALISSLVVAVTVTPSVYFLMLKKTKRKVMKNTKRVMMLMRVIFIMSLSFIAFYDSEINVVLPIIAVVFFGGATYIKDLWLSKSTFQLDSNNHKGENNQFESNVSNDGIGIVRRYAMFLNWLLMKKKRQFTMLGIGFLVLISSGLLIPLGILKINLFPNNEPSSITINITAPGGTTLEQTQKIVAQVESILIDEPAVRIFNTAIGGQNSAEAAIAVTFFDKKEMPYDGFRALDNLEREFKKVPNATIEIVVASQGGPPSDKAISLEFLADDYEAGKQIADDYLKKLYDMPGVYNAAVSVKDSGPTKTIVIDKLEAARYGLTISAIAAQVNTAINGIVATTIKEGQNLIDVRLIYNDSHNTLSMDISNIMIQTRTGDVIPLSAVAGFETSQGLSMIEHSDRKRIVTLEADVMDGYNATEITDKLLEMTSDVIMPNGVSLNVSGEIAQIEDSFKDLFRSMILAILLVFVILTLQFKSILQPFAILTTVPMAFIGVFYGLTITGNEFGFYAFMGLVALVGIAVNDAIVLIDFMNQQRKEAVPLKKAIITSGITRFNPVLATTLTTIGGVLPLAFREVYYAQFSYTLIFGLLVTTMMTLLFIPVSYHLLEMMKLRLIKEENR